jgi:hypothetical protein
MFAARFIYQPLAEMVLLKSVECIRRRKEALGQIEKKMFSFIKSDARQFSRGLDHLEPERCRGVRKCFSPSILLFLLLLLRMAP